MKNAYLSPATGSLDISIIRDARPYTTISLDLGIPNFTVFSIKLPLVEDTPNAMSQLVAEAVHILLDEVSAFMLSLNFDQQVIVQIYSIVLNCFKGMTGESDTNKALSEVSKDPTVKTFEGTFKMPMEFINETYSKVVTATSNEIDFKQWFRGSKVVDSSGKPLKVYHGTIADFNKFKVPPGAEGLFFTTNPEVAHTYTGYSRDWEEEETDEGNLEGARIIPAYLKIKKPLVVSPLEYLRGKKQVGNITIRMHDIASFGYDGLKITADPETDHLFDGDSWMVVKPNQIRSAISLTAKGKAIKRTPVRRHLELTHDKPEKITISDARTIIQKYRNRSLKSQPGPLYIIVYDTYGNAKATIPVGNTFKNQLLNQLYKKADKKIEFTPTVKFDNDIEMKTTNAEGIPKSIYVGNEPYIPVATINQDMALYSNEKDEWIVKFPDGRCVAFTDRPMVSELKDDNYPVPTEYTNWLVLTDKETPESSDKSEAVDERGLEVIDSTESETDPISDLKADDDKNEQLEEGKEEEGKTSALKIALNIPKLLNEFGAKIEARYQKEYKKEVTAQSLIDQISSLDPTANKEYTAWIVGQYARGGNPAKPTEGISRFEDIASRTIPTLTRYNDLKKAGKLQPEEKDINRIKGLNPLEALVDKYKSEDTTSKRQLESNKLISSGAATIFFNDAQYKVVIPRTEEAAKYFGINTKWCTAARNHNLFSHYANDPLYIILIKAQNKRFQFDFVVAQFMDETDTPIDTEEFCEEYPVLANVFLPLAEKADNSCSSCGGSGNILCENTDISECYEGEVTCQWCDRGFVDCDDCHGLGTIETDEGEESCDSCYGEGKTYCDQCDGDGSEKCSVCGGRGAVDCGECDGLGTIAGIQGFLDWKAWKNKQQHLQASKRRKRSDHYDEKGFWVGDGGGASGILPICTTTGRICLAWRSSNVSMGDCWGTIGGAIQEGMSPAESAKMELIEEVGYRGAIRLIPAYVFTSGSFKYHNFLGLLTTEFKLSPMPGGHQGVSFSGETDAIEWITWEDLQGYIDESPQDFHQGLISLIENSWDQIEKINADIKQSNTEKVNYAHTSRTHFDEP